MNIRKEGRNIRKEGRKESLKGGQKQGRGVEGGMKEAIYEGLYGGRKRRM